MSISGINYNSHTFYAQNGTQNETITAQCLQSNDTEMNIDCCTTGVCRGWLPPSSYYCDQNNYCNITNQGIAFPIIIVLILVCIWASGWYFMAVNEGWIEDDFLTNCSDLFRYCRGLFENQAVQSAHGRPSNVAQSSGLPTNVAAYGQNAVTYNAAYHRERSVSGEESISGERSPSGEGAVSGERSPASALANSVETRSIKAGLNEKIPQECSVSGEGSLSGEGSPSGEGFPASALTNSVDTGSIKAGTKEKIPKECSVSDEGSPSGEGMSASALTNSVDT